MSDDKRLDLIISNLYEAPLNPDLWPKILGLCGQYAGGVDAQLTIFDKESLRATTTIMSGRTFSIEIGVEYASRLHAIDPVTKLTQKLPVYSPQCSHHHYNQAFVSRSEFYQEFLIPNGIRHGLFVKLEESEESFSVFASMRAVDQKPFDDLHKHASMRFIKHLERALRLQKHIQHLQIQTEITSKVVDSLATALFITDSRAHIIYLNVQAEELIKARESGIAVKSSRLSCAASTDSIRLARLIKSATIGYPATGDVMPLEGRQYNMKVIVMPVSTVLPLISPWQSPLALIAVLKMDQSLEALKLIRNLYNLSPAELNVTAALLEGKTPEDYCQENFVSISTVRTHLKNLFRKTDTRRQAELVALLGRMLLFRV